MKKIMRPVYNELKATKKAIKGIISELEGKVMDIRQKTQDRDMTDKEEEKYFDLQGQLNDLDNCIDYVQNAMDCLEGNIID